MAVTERLAVEQRARRRSRWWALAAVAVILVAVALVVRLASESAPVLRASRVVAAQVRLPGGAPDLDWPREGQAAVAVQGLGGAASVGPQEPVPIASVAKVMTAYLTLLEHPLAAGRQGFVITITPAAVRDERRRAALGQSTVPVRAGERLTEREALEALLIPSANNVAELLAIKDAGTEAAFVARMNAAAAGLGMGSTTYTDPSGYQAGTVSTAVDQLRLARAALREPAFAAIVDEPSAQLPVAGRVSNFDGLVRREGYVGVKTGSDRAAGGCLVFAKRVLVDGHRATVLGVVLGQREGSLIESALVSGRRLGNSAASALRVQTVLPAGTTVLSASAADGGGTTAVTTRAIRALGWGGLELRLRLLVRPAMTGVRAGEQLGTAAVRSTFTATAPAVAASSVGGPSLGWRLSHLF